MKGSTCGYIVERKPAESGTTRIVAHGLGPTYFSLLSRLSFLSLPLSVSVLTSAPAPRRLWASSTSGCGARAAAVATRQRRHWVQRVSTRACARTPPARGTNSGSVCGSITWWRMALASSWKRLILWPLRPMTVHMAKQPFFWACTPPHATRGSAQGKGTVDHNNSMREQHIGRHNASRSAVDSRHFSHMKKVEDGPADPA